MNFINKNTLLIVILLLLTGCAGGSLKDTVLTVMDNRDFKQRAPDEFMTVTKAPLIMPPDYELRPPKEGVKGISEKEPDDTARTYILKSESSNSELSLGEQSILKKANVAYANPRIKEELLLEAGIVEKNESLADYLIRLKKENSEVLDTYGEVERLKTLETVVINIPLENSAKNNTLQPEVEEVNLNKLTLERLRNKTNIVNNNAILKYDIRSEDVLNKNSDIPENINKEIPPIDKQTTLLKGLMGGLMGGFGIF